MIVKEAVVVNAIGLHSRPAQVFIDEANKYVSCIFVEAEDKRGIMRRVNAKSLLGILSLGVTGSQEIRIIANGPDEEAAVRNLVGLIETA